MEVPFLDISVQNSRLRDKIDVALFKVLNSNQFIGGKTVIDFETQIEEYLSVKYAITCGNGTDALMLALRACDIRPGDEVITTAFSFFATAEAIVAVGAKPVFVDILPDSYLMDPGKIEEAITPRTKVILPVQIFGACCDMDRICKIAKKHGLMVVEDDAQAIGSAYRGRKAGTLGDIGCFSFYPTKNLGGMGDGGMCTTNSEELAIRISAIKEHGAGVVGAQALESFTGRQILEPTGEQATGLYNPLKYYNYLIGYNSRLDAFQAAILSIKLPHLDQYNIRRREIAAMYHVGLSAAVGKPRYDMADLPCFHQYAILTDRKKELIDHLAAHGIGTGNFYPVPLHHQKAFYEDNCANYGVELPKAEFVCDHVVCLPIYPELLDCQVEYVIQTINDFFHSDSEENPRNLFIHPTADVDSKADIGRNTKIWNNAQVREGAVVGEDCIIGKNTYIDTQVHIGDRVKIQNNVNVYKGVILEDDTFVGPSATFTNDMFPRAFSKDWEVHPTLVKKGASIGANATIRCGVVIGEYAMIGCGSVVTKDVPDYALVVGNPARQIGRVDKDGNKASESGGFMEGEAGGIHL